MLIADETVSPCILCWSQVAPTSDTIVQSWLSLWIIPRYSRSHTVTAAALQFESLFSAQVRPMILNICNTHIPWRYSAKAIAGSQAAFAFSHLQQCSMPGQYDTGSFDPSPVTLQLAQEPAHPVLPRQVQQRPAPKTRRERIPLSSSLIGPGRAGTETTLFGSHGSRYIGQVLSGRPHGVGQYWAQAVQAGQALQLVYDGEFVRGVRHGQGTAYFHSRGEVYSGQWQDGRRTGQGKLTYADGAVYDGMWSKDVRHGVGTMYSPNGSIFVGTYVSDKRQGLGVTYWGSRCKKHVAEYVDDTPTCGSMLDLADDEVEVPATQQLRDAIAAARVKAAGAAAAADSTTQPCMPELQLVQPSQVLCRGFAAVRQWREQQHRGQSGRPAAAAIDAVSGTLAANTMSLLRHAFILTAGGDDLAAHVLPHQLQELIVLAGLDPAAPAVVKLLTLLQQRIEARGGAKLFLDDLLDVANFFRQTTLAEQMQQQQPATEGAVAAAAAAADGELQGGEVHCGQQQWCAGDDAGGAGGRADEEVWQEGDEAGGGEEQPTEEAEEAEGEHGI